MYAALQRPVLVSLGALSALLAVLAIFDQSWEMAYGWLGVGLLADILLSMGLTQASSEDASPELDSNGWDDDRVTGAISYLNCVFVPVIAVVHAGFLDGATGSVVAALIVVSGTYRLAFHDWAVPVTYFEGFPAAWGAVGFLLHAFDATPLAAALVIGFVLILGLVPIYWPHPVHVTQFRTLTRLVTLVWALAAASVLWRGFPAGWQMKTLLIIVGLYGVVLTIARAVWPPETIADRPKRSHAVGLAGLDDDVELPEHTETTDAP